MMIGHRQYDVSDQAMAQAWELGITGDVKKRVARMARRSANCSHPEGNRRFEDYIFKIEDGVVKSVVLLNGS
jgi:hypothetical protein